MGCFLDNFGDPEAIEGAEQYLDGAFGLWLLEVENFCHNADAVEIRTLGRCIIIVPVARLAQHEANDSR